MNDLNSLLLCNMTVSEIQFIILYCMDDYIKPEQLIKSLTIAVPFQGISQEIETNPTPTTKPP